MTSPTCSVWRSIPVTRTRSWSRPASNHGVFRSGDGGVSWEPVLAPLPDRFGGQSPAAITATP